MRPIIDPKPEDEVWLRIGKGEYKPVTIIDGAFLRNDRVSNFWKWRDDETGEIEEGYGDFYESDKEEVGQYKVTDVGIEKVVNVEDFGCYTATIVIPKEVFIEAYEKYITGEKRE